MTEASPRIDDLRRRLLKDPASLAFAQLGEELRRAGELQESIKICRAGLGHHPEYLSARVTLGRALLASNQLDEALVELSAVLRTAPENLAALRGLGETHQRRGDALAAVAAFQRALALAPQDADLAALITTIEPSARAHYDAANRSWPPVPHAGSTAPAAASLTAADAATGTDGHLAANPSPAQPASGRTALARALADAPQLPRAAEGMDAHELLAMWPAAPDAVEPECGDMLAAWPEDPTATPESAIPAAWGEGPGRDAAPGLTIKSGRHSTTLHVVRPTPAAARLDAAEPPPVVVAPAIVEPSSLQVATGDETVGAEDVVTLSTLEAGVFQPPTLEPQAAEPPAFESAALAPPAVEPAVVEPPQVELPALPVALELPPLPIALEAEPIEARAAHVDLADGVVSPAGTPDETATAEQAPTPAPTQPSAVVAALAETALSPVEAAQVAMLERWLAAIQAARASQDLPTAR